MMKGYAKVVAEMTDEKAIEYLYGNGYVDLKVADYIAKRLKRGKWIDEGGYVTTAYGHLDVYRCSACNIDITIDDYDSYCPNCGAKMGE